MIDIGKEFQNQICTFCRYRNIDECENIQIEENENLSVYKCLNYRRRNIAMKEFSEYILYTYYDEVGKYIAIKKKNVPEGILKQMKLKFDEVKDKE